MAYEEKNSRLDAKMILAGKRHGASAFVDIAKRYPDRFPDLQSVMDRIKWIEAQDPKYRKKIQKWIDKFAVMPVIQWTAK